LRGDEVRLGLGLRLVLRLRMEAGWEREMIYGEEETRV
jgi:hypothetical protein